MSVFLRRTLCSSCLHRRLSRSFSSTSFVSRPAASQDAPPLPLDRHVTQSERDSRPVKVPRKKRATGSPAKKHTHTTPKEPHRNLLQNTKLQEYLDHIASTGQEVTLTDVERYRPSEHPSPRSPEYEEQYNTLVETLVRSFSLDQLRKFLDMYHLNATPKRNKWEIATAIIERQWCWPSLATMKKRKRDWTEVIHESFPLDARQSFLILGKDGADLLALSTEFNAHVSFSANPLCLKVEGLRGSLDNLSRHIEDFKSGIKEQLFRLPSGEIVEQASVQRISRMSGVFVEDMGQGLIRISHRREGDRAAHYAKRLTIQAAVNVTQEIPTLVCPPYVGSLSTMPQSLSPPSIYALYPFLSSRSGPSVIEPGNLFRVRRVGDWLRSTLSGRPRDAGHLAEGGILMNFYGEPVDLRQSLLSHVAAISHDQISSRITASFGHVLVSSASSQDSSITPPLRGTSELLTILGWLRSQTSDRCFIPRIPPQMINSPPMQQRLIHRLVYHSFPIKESEDFRATKVLNFELVLELLNPSAPNLSINHSENHSRGSYPIDRDVNLEPTCSTGSFSHLDLMMPDRFVLLESTVTPVSQWP
ncbi:hypothetical protein FPV67DRAFT_1663244 [Lyophyllum atratum]|nr:hypothetical protein FPV67DRAFT_1663244 [Lyophyllum atratum]